MKKILLCVCFLSLGGCEKTYDALGLSRQEPDEFNITTREPLYFPSQNTLHKPDVGKSSPFLLKPQDQARTLLGIQKHESQTILSPLERNFLREINRFRISPTIRQDLLQDQHVTMDAWAKKMLYWHEKGSPLNPYDEYKRLYHRDHPSVLMK